MVYEVSSHSFRISVRGAIVQSTICTVHMYSVEVTLSLLGRREDLALRFYFKIKICFAPGSKPRTTRVVLQSTVVSFSAHLSCTSWLFKFLNLCSRYKTKSDFYIVSYYKSIVGSFSVLHSLSAFSRRHSFPFRTMEILYFVAVLFQGQNEKRLSCHSTSR